MVLCWSSKMACNRATCLGGRWLLNILLLVLLLGGCAGKDATTGEVLIAQARQEQTENTAQAWELEKATPNYLTLARELVRQQHYQVALRQLELAEKDKKSAEIYYLEGVCYRETDRPQEALHLFHKALAYNEAYGDAYNGIGLTYGKTGQAAQSIDALKKAVGFDPARADYINNLGFALLRNKDVQEAEQYFLRSLSVDPAFSTAQNNLALCYGFQGRYREAMQLLLRNNSPETAYRNMGGIFTMLGEQEKAGYVLRKAEKLKDVK